MKSEVLWRGYPSHGSRPSTPSPRGKYPAAENKAFPILGILFEFFFFLGDVPAELSRDYFLRVLISGK